jgi:dsRNA-specific ribonuclease
VAVSFAGQELGRGEGKSKKEAAQIAAEKALRSIPEREPSVKENGEG